MANGYFLPKFHRAHITLVVVVIDKKKTNFNFVNNFLLIKTYENNY